MYARVHIKAQLITILLCCWQTQSLLRDFSVCQDDFSLTPSDGILKDHTFMWLGFTQYLHVITGLPHQSKAPRVTLIHRQFVVGTASDMLKLPKNYKLGVIIFGDYERDETDCELTMEQIKHSVRCPKAYIEIPITDITPHPEYSRFGVGNSLALVKLIRPMKSNYVVPICLPSTYERGRRKKNKAIFMVDYISTVPNDFDIEKMAKKTLKLYTHRECRRHRLRSKLSSEGVTHVLCSSGCGIRPGAPIITQNSEGAFELVGIAAGGGPCTKKTMRRRLNEEPPLYVDVYPYTPWIVNVITAFILPMPYPQNFMLTEAGTRVGLKKTYLRKRKVQKEGWRARTYAVGDFCFMTLKRQRKGALFYSEKFEVNADPPAKVYLTMKISAGFETTIVCARLLMPNRLSVPRIDGVGGYNITVFFETDWFPYSFYFSLGLVGLNSTASDMAEWHHERKPGFW